METEERVPDAKWPSGNDHTWLFVAEDDVLTELFFSSAHHSLTLRLACLNGSRKDGEKRKMKML